MKKLSLALILAAGFVSANAVSFEEALKGVEYDGWLRYRFNNDASKHTYQYNKFNYKGNEHYHRLTGKLNVKFKIDDNFYAGTGLKFDSVDAYGETASINSNFWENISDKDGATSNRFHVQEYYGGFKFDNTDIRAGRQTVGSFFTDDMVGTGIKVTNTDIAGLAFTAFAFDNLEADEDIGTLWSHDYDGVAIKYKDYDRSTKTRTFQNNLYGLSAAGSFNPISFDVSFAHLANIANFMSGDLSGLFNLSDNVLLSFKAQAGWSKIEEFAGYYKENVYNPNTGTTIPIETYPFDDGLLLAGELGLNAYGLGVRVGYVSFGTKEDMRSFNSFEDKGWFVRAGEQLVYDIFNYSNYEGKNHYCFGALDYNIAPIKTKLGVEYLQGEKKFEGKKTTADELVFRAVWSPSKKISFNTYFSMAKQKTDTTTDKNQQFRINAMYVF